MYPNTPSGYAAALAAAGSESLLWISGDWIYIKGADVPPPASEIGAEDVPFKTSSISSYVRSVAAKLMDGAVSVWDHIPVELHDPIRLGTNTTVLTSYIQAALDEAYGPLLSGKRPKVRPCYLGNGAFLTGTLYVDEGVDFYGDGGIETTAKNATRLIQAPGTGDVIRFRGHVDTANGRTFWYGKIRDFCIFGDWTSGTSDGWGISFRNADGSTVCPQDTTCVSDITIRGMQRGGIEFADGALPLSVDRIKTVHCNGPGIHFKGSTNAHQAVHFNDLSSDSCNGGGLVLDNLDARGSVLITNYKSERRINTAYGSTAMQDNAVVINNPSAGAVVAIIGGTHVCSVPDVSNPAVLQKPGSFVRIYGTNTPDLTWAGLNIRISDGSTGNTPLVVESSTVAIPLAVKSGRLSASVRVDRTPEGVTALSVFGQGNTYQVQSLETVGYQIAGETPALTLWARTAEQHKHGWGFFAKPDGTLSARTVADDATNYEFMRVSRGIYNDDRKKPYRVELYRPEGTLGTPLNGSHFTMSAGWGDTASVVTVNGCRDNRFEIQVTAGGSGIAANPTIVLNFVDGAYLSSPQYSFRALNYTDKTAVVADLEAEAARLTITLYGTPVAGKVYKFVATMT